jgi:hypothetical protein
MEIIICNIIYVEESKLINPVGRTFIFFEWMILECPHFSNGKYLIWANVVLVLKDLEKELRLHVIWG